jgi:glucosamine 6-phosphate synthetase-like amidotransferase/phosphosugar isomerase protein
MDTNGVNADRVEHSPGAMLSRMEIELNGAAAAGTETWPQIRDAARQVPGGALDAILLTGCGDSYYAGLGLRGLLEAAAGVPVLVQPAMEAVTFPSALITPRALVVGISVSGKVERTIQAVAQHRGRSGPTVSISAYADSDLGLAADAAIATGIRGTPGPVPGTANYVGSMLGLLAIALELGERRDAAPFSDADVLTALDALDATVAAGGGLAKAEASVLEPPFFSIGSGPDLGSSWFGVAKFIEAAATVGVAQDLEEWAHEQFFTTVPGTTVFVHATSAAVHQRARRVAGSVVKVGGRLVSVASDPLGIAGEHHWPLAAVDERLAPLVAWVPGAMTALAYARHAGRHPFGIDLPGRMRTVDEDIYLAQPNRV